MRNSKHLWTGVAVAGLILIGLMIVYMFLTQREHFQGAAGLKKVVVNYYFLEKCPHCVAFSPEWEKFVQNVSGDTSIETNKVNGGSGKVPPYVKGFPYVEVAVGSKKPKEYTGERTADALLGYIKEQRAP